jgi:hypothetical protein
MSLILNPGRPNPERLSRRRLFGAAAAVVLGGALRTRAQAQPARAGRLHAVVVGIDAYRAVPRLRGAVNDARAVAEALQPYAASLRVMTDAEVTRAAVVAAWGAVLGQAAPGDIVLLTYSGHGGRERRRSNATRIGTRDGTLILPNFAQGSGPGVRERLFDDEVNQLFVEPGRRGVRVVLVVDACHSGTMTRSADPRADGITYRSIGEYQVDDLAVAAEAPPTPPAPPELRHVVYLAAGQENEMVPELSIDGAMHGAMSWSFARALAGGADENRDGRITWGALSRTVLRNVRTVADAMQHPELRPADRIDDVLFVRNAPPPAPQAAAQPYTVRLRVLELEGADRDRLFADLQGATPAASANEADAIWDSGTHELLTTLGDIVAHDVTEARLQGALDKLVAVAVVRQLAANAGLDTRLLLHGESIDDPPSRDSDRTHVRGTRLAFAAAGMRYPNLILVNLGGDGTVQFLYPRPGDPVAVNISRPYVLNDFTVTPPYGADHLVAIASEQPLTELAATLRRLDGQRAARELAALLAQLPPAGVQVGVQGIFTAPR